MDDMTANRLDLPTGNAKRQWMSPRHTIPPSPNDKDPQDPPSTFNTLWPKSYLGLTGETPSGTSDTPLPPSAATPACSEGGQR